MFNIIQKKVTLGDHEITLETGRLARQADGSVLVSCGDNRVLVTVVSSRRETDADFFPLTVEYSEKMYATGKIPGGYFKREGRPTTLSTLSARLIDRPMRPCFPEGYNFETQIVATILSADGVFPPEILASLGASTAVHISDIPFNGPTAAIQIGQVDGKWVLNPSPDALESSTVDFVVAGTKNGLLMVEGESQFISEEKALEALQFAHKSMEPLFKVQEELRKEIGLEKRTYTAYEVEASSQKKYTDFLTSKVEAGLKIRSKADRYSTLSEARKEALKHFIDGVTDKDQIKKIEKDVSITFENLKFKISRTMVTKGGARIDGRNNKQIRPIVCDTGLLPRAHGSGFFTRGETQVLSAVTLGTTDDALAVETLSGKVTSNFMLHYNFPPYSVGETGRMGGQSRREIGHGYLAERALKAILPPYEKFPYTIRIVGEVLESNGSSSMGTVCSGLLALLDAGVPVKGNVAGIAMGLIKEGNDIVVLSDILGDEDHLGDMDFKVAGTRDGITALQMDIKIDSIGFDVMKTALNQANEGRTHILGEMEKVMKTPRGEISEYAPRIQTIQIKPDKVREVIGPGGKVIKGIIEATGVKVNIEDDGKVHIASTDPVMAKKAIQMVMDICAEAEVGKVYNGKVIKILDFGALVEVLPNTSGLLHISELAHERVKNVTDVLNEGDQVSVKVLDIDRSGRIKLSRKVLLDH
jgi:polyribonucleotide nucleotidyltransferase